jgi:hypothetical protein
MTKRTKTIKKPKSKEVIKPLTKQEIKKKLNTMVSYDVHPDSIYKKS